MKFHIIVVASILIILFLFAGLNWELVIQTQKFNLVFAEFEAPLGIMLLTVVVLLCLLYIIHVGAIETRVLIQNRRSTKELEKARGLAEEKETSRINALNEFLSRKLESMERKLNDILTQLEFTNNSSSIGDRPEEISEPKKSSDTELR